MVDYLKSKQLTFTSYVIGVYNGCVWADEFLIGAIGMMYNVQITVISPYFSNVWNVFHDGHAQPDIVLVCNGAYFGSGRDNITHFSGKRANLGNVLAVAKQLMKLACTVVSVAENSY